MFIEKKIIIILTADGNLYRIPSSNTKKSIILVDDEDIIIDNHPKRNRENDEDFQPNKKRKIAATPLPSIQTTTLTAIFISNPLLVPFSPSFSFSYLSFPSLQSFHKLNVAQSLDTNAQHVLLYNRKKLFITPAWSAKQETWKMDSYIERNLENEATCSIGIELNQLDADFSKSILGEDWYDAKFH